MAPVKGVPKPKGVNWLVAGRSHGSGEGGTVLRRDIRRAREGEVMDLAEGPTAGINQLQQKHRALGIETKRAPSGFGGRDVLVSYVPESLHQGPVEHTLDQVKEGLHDFFGRRK